MEPSINDFDKNQYVSLGTFRKSGVPVDTPVWFAADGGKLYVFSAGDAGKVKRLRNSPLARIAPCDVRGGLKGPFRETHARLIDDPALIERALAAFRTKYGLLMRLTDFGARITGRMKKRAYIEVDY